MSPRAFLPRLHVVTDDEVMGRDGWPRAAVSVLEAGGPAVALQLRGPRTMGSVVFSMVEKMLPYARTVGAMLVVNDHLDVALASGNGAVHLAGRSLPLGEARRLTGAAACVGVSCHSARCVSDAYSEGADYAFAGTVFRTPSHPGRDGLGPAGVRAIVATAGTMPVIGIGGIGVGAVGAVIGAGAYGVAVLRGVWDAAEPASAVREYISSLTESVRAAGVRARSHRDREGREGKEP